MSFPGPDRSVTQEGLKQYRVSNRRYRNRRIGDFLKELHLTEGRNTGFKKILNALEANGSPRPEFETDDDRSYFITRLFIHEAFIAEGDEESESTPKSTPTGTMDNESKKMSLREQILTLIKTNPHITKKEMSQKLGVSMYALNYSICMTERRKVNVLWSEMSYVLVEKYLQKMKNICSADMKLQTRTYI